MGLSSNFSHQSIEILHNCGKSRFEMRKWQFSIAMLVYQRVILPFSQLFPWPQGWLGCNRAAWKQMKWARKLSVTARVRWIRARHAHTGQHMSEITHLDSQIDSNLDLCISMSNIGSLFWCGLQIVQPQAELKLVPPPEAEQWRKALWAQSPRKLAAALSGWAEEISSGAGSTWVGFYGNI